MGSLFKGETNDIWWLLSQYHAGADKIPRVRSFKAAHFIRRAGTSEEMLRLALKDYNNILIETYKNSVD